MANEAALDGAAAEKVPVGVEKPKIGVHGDRADAVKIFIRLDGFRYVCQNMLLVGPDL